MTSRVRPVDILQAFLYINPLNPLKFNVRLGVQNVQSSTVVRCYHHHELR
jgi:hypothetical protein